MDCLDNFIGISSRCEGVAAPRSGMFIEDLEGLSVKSLALSETGKYLTVQNLINQKMRVAGVKLAERLGVMLGDVLIQNSVDALIPPGFCENYADAVGSGTAGLIIEKRPTAFSKILIPRIYFKSHTSVTNLVVTITDGVNPETHTISAAADEDVIIEAAYTTLQRSVRITYTSGGSTQVQPYEGDIERYWQFLIEPPCEPCGCGHRYLSIKGLDFDGTEKTAYRGIKADVELLCDKEKMVCMIAPQNKTLMLYLLGVEILGEVIASDRFNFLAIASKDWAKETRQLWLNRVEELLYVNGPGIQNLLVHTEPKCFNCRGYEYQEILP